MPSLPRILLRLVFLSTIVWLCIFIIHQMFRKDKHEKIKYENEKFIERLTEFPKIELENERHALNSHPEITQGYSNIFKDGLCENVKRPSQDSLLYRNDRWQYFVNDVGRQVYVLDAYYDEREGVSPMIRILPMAVVPGRKRHTITGNDKLYAMLWYDDMEHPVSVECPCIQNHTTVYWNVHEHQYGILYHEIVLERHDVLPTHVSLMHGPCIQPTTLMKVVIPEKPTYKSRDIALCVKGIWGNMTRENAPYIVNWMETLRLFGLKHVHMYYVALNLQDHVIKNVFQHYTDSKFLHFEYMNSYLHEDGVSYMDSALSQATMLPVVNDCYFRNMHKYDFILHHDTDEILIPNQHHSYREMLDEFISENPIRDKFESLISRSAFFYTYYEPYNASYPDYMVFLRNAYRQPVEIPAVTWNRGVGVMKSFQNTKSCAIMNIHACKSSLHSKKYGHTFIPPATVLSHHYRDVCKFYERCETEKERRLADTSIADAIGPRLIESVHGVLDKAGYFD